MDQFQQPFSPAYNQITISNNASVIPIVAAVDPTLATNTDYIQVTGIFDAQPSGQQYTNEQRQNALLINSKGVYRIEVWCTVTSSVNNTYVGLKFSVNDVITLVRRPIAKIGTGGDKQLIAAHGFVPFNPGDIVKLLVAATNTSNITFQDMVFSATKMRNNQY